MIDTRYHDIFTLPVDTPINPVNCKGAMGKGLALQFKNRFPGLNMTKIRKENRQNPDCAATNSALSAANTIVDMNLFEEQRPRQRMYLFISREPRHAPRAGKGASDE